MKMYIVLIYFLFAVLEIAGLVFFLKKFRKGGIFPSRRSRLWQFLIDLPVLFCIIGRLIRSDYMGKEYLWLMVLTFSLYFVNMILYWVHRTDLPLVARLLVIVVDVIVVGYLALSPVLPEGAYEENAKGTAYKLYYAAATILLGQRLFQRMDDREKE